ncbi:MAG: cytochrome c [Planctomycetota bacterium]|jgi:cytochrome c
MSIAVLVIAAACAAHPSQESQSPGTTGTSAPTHTERASAEQVVAPTRTDAPPDDRFDKRVLLRGLARPMELEVAPNGLVFLIELEGTVSVYDPQAAERHAVLELEVFAEQENGLLGLALDPDFARTRHVFLLYSPVDWIGQRVSRFTWDGVQLVPESEVVLLEWEEQRRECCHHAGSIEFGSDGLLFIAVGDNTHPHGDSQGFAPLDERSDRFPWDAQRSSANSAVLGGKVLRVRPMAEGGVEIPDGNLFPGGEGGRPEIYAMGCRNPWRIGVDQSTGFVYWGEVGPDAYNDGERGPRGYDEINQARTAGNFGWPLFIADNEPYAWVDYESGEAGARFDPQRPVNRSPNNTGARVLPPAVPAWIYYPYGASTEFPQLNAPGGRTACAGPVYDFDASVESSTKLPRWFDRALFVFEWSRNWIKVIHLDEDSNIAAISPLPGGFTFKRPIDIDIAPDGTLYVLEYGETWNANPDSALVRIDFHPGNRPPKARAAAHPTAGAAPLRVQLSAEGSHDLDGDELTYSWRLADGSVLGDSAELDVQLGKPGEPLGETVVELVVSDSSGASARTSVGVLVGNTPPEVSLTSPRDGGFFSPGDELSWKLDVSDAEDGAPNADDAEWWIEGTAFRASFVEGAPPRADALDEHPAVVRMRASDCFNCHAVNRRVVGPAFMEIAERYAGEDGASEAAEARVRDGSADVWGSQPMLPHPDLPPEALREMVSWIMDLESEEASTQLQRGYRGSVQTDEDAPNGSWVLEASYKDGGGVDETVPSLTGHSRRVVRSRRVEAEHFTDCEGPATLESETASGGSFLGAVYDGHSLRFDGVDLAGIGSVRASVSSNGVGGIIELRHGGPDGAVLASFTVDNNGAWEEWHTLEQSIVAPSGKEDLVVQFRAGEKEGALLNLDWLEFVPEDEAPSPPNVIYIMSDELAYFEMSHMGNPYIRTPRIDRMVAEGVRFTHAYAGSPVCAPLRSTLLTGKHAGHASVRANDGGTPLRADEATIASLLKARGYATGGYGKWGCGGRDSTGVPEAHGFDDFFGYYDQVHAHSFYPPYLVRNSEEVPLEGNEGGRSGATYSHYRIMDEAVDFIRGSQSEPFFCYLPITPPHGMYDIPDNDPAWKLYENDGWMSDPAISQDVKSYAAMVSMVDRNLGEVLDLLDELELAENTIVFFTGDNGGQDRFRSAAHPRGFFGPNVDPRTGVEFRGGKGNLFEGGLRIPFVVRWPGRIEGGRVSDHVFYQPDVLPTLSALCGAEVPKGTDGLSFLPALLAEGEQPQHEFLYWEFGSQLAVRKGRWKGILQRKSRGNWKQVLDSGEGEWALFDVERDVSEAHDVAGEHPDVVAELARVAAREYTPVRPGSYTDPARTRHERDRWAKWGTTRKPQPKRNAKVNRIEAVDLIPPANLSIVRFSSESEGNGKLAKNAIDGDPSTVWHSRWSESKAEPPHDLVIDLGAMYRVRGFRYLTRQDQSWNGSFARTEFYVAATPDGFGDDPVASRTFEKTREAQAVDLKAPTMGRYVRVRVISEVGGNVWGSAAEVGVIGDR